MRIISTFLIGLIALSSINCKKFLEQPPANRLSNDDIFKDLEGARTTLIGCYDNLKDANYHLRYFSIYPELAGGNIKYGRLTSQPLLNTYNFTNTTLSTTNEMTGFYQVAYNTIYRANNIFAYINNVKDANALQKNRMLAEAYTLRAMCHFDLVRVFAQPYNFTADAGHEGIILRTANVDALVPVGPPATVKQVYDRVIADLDSAIILYSNSVPIYSGGTASSYLSGNAAKALLSRVLLYKGDWARATQMCNEVLAANSTLISNSQYVQSWRRKAGGTMDNEAIFLLWSRIDVNQGSYGDNFNTNNTVFGVMATSNDLLNLYSANDVRGRNSMFVQKTLSGITGQYTLKYQGGNDSADNYKVIRNSEIYLNRAEAYAERDSTVQALADLNRIRQRANPTAPALTFTTKQQLIDSILVERRRELCFEGHLLFDLARRKKDLVRLDCSGSNCSFTYPNPLYACPKPTLR